MSRHPLITTDPDRLGGAPCVRTLRVRAADVLDLLASGMSTEGVLNELPYLEEADVTACLAYAADLARDHRDDAC